MRPRLFVLRLVVVAALLVLGSIAGACGGDDDDELTLEEYFQRVDALGDDLDDELDRLDQEFEETFAGAETEEEVMRAYHDSFDLLPGLFKEFVAELEIIDPPPDVEDLHGEMVTVQAEGLEMLKDLNERIQRAESPSEVQELAAEVERPGFLAISDRTEEVCFELEAIADANGIDVDLECEE